MASLNDFDVVEKANEGSILYLTDPYNNTGEILTDEGEKIADEENIKPFFIRLLGSDSDTFRKGISVRVNRYQKMKKKTISSEESIRDNAKLFAECTTECYMIYNDKFVECNVKEMTFLYLKYPWLREIADEFMNDRSNLMTS